MKLGHVVTIFKNLTCHIEDLAGNLYTNITVPVELSHVQNDDYVYFDPDNKILITIIDSMRSYSFDDLIQILDREITVPKDIDILESFIKGNYKGLIGVIKNLGVVLASTIKNQIQLNEDGIKIFFDKLQFKSNDELIDFKIDEIHGAKLVSFKLGDMKFQSDLQTMLLIYLNKNNYIKIIDNVLEIKIFTYNKKINLNEDTEEIQDNIKLIKYTLNTINAALKNLQLTADVISIQSNIAELHGESKVHISSSKEIDIQSDSKINLTSSNINQTALSTIGLPGTFNRTNSIFTEKISNIGSWEVNTLGPISHSGSIGEYKYAIKGSIVTPLFYFNTPVYSLVRGEILNSALTQALSTIYAYLTMVDSAIFAGLGQSVLSQIPAAVSLLPTALNTQVRIN